MTERTGSTSRRAVLRAGAGTAAAAATVSTTASADEHEAWVEAIEEYLESADNFDGSFADHRDEDEVEIEVGAGDGFQFSPPAVQISPGTTVRWVWTGEGGQHNVVHDAEELDDIDETAFESETTGDEGHTFEHTFEEAGAFRYVCTPHRTVDMFGGILVSDADIDTDPGLGISAGWAAAGGALFTIPLLYAVYLLMGETN